MFCNRGVISDQNLRHFKNIQNILNKSPKIYKISKKTSKGDLCTQIFLYYFQRYYKLDVVKFYYYNPWLAIYNN